MSKLSKEKGKRGEREIVCLLQDVVDNVCKKIGKDRVIIQRNHMQCHLGGSDIAGLPQLAIEVKFCAICTPGLIDDWWKQCISQSNDDQVAVLFFRRGQEWRVRMGGYIGIKEITKIGALVETSTYHFERWLAQKLELDWKAK